MRGGNQRHICSAEQVSPLLPTIRKGKKCFYFEQSLRKHTLKSQPLLESSKGTFWHMK